MMPPHNNVDTLQRAWLRFKVRDLDGYLAMYSDSVIHHGFSSRILPGVRGLRDHYANLLKGFPDLRVEIEDVIADGEKVAHRFMFSGTHRGDFLGIAPTGKRIAAAGMQIDLFSGSKCVEVWSVHDSYCFLAGIGAVTRVRDRAKAGLA